MIENLRILAELKAPQELYDNVLIKNIKNENNL